MGLEDSILALRVKEHKIIFKVETALNSCIDYYEGYIKYTPSSLGPLFGLYEYEYEGDN